MFNLQNPDHAYLMGLLQTDGHHSGQTDAKGKITLELNSRDGAILTQLQEVIPYKTSISTRTRVTPFSPESNTSTLLICSQEARKNLEELGLPTGVKADNIAPPTVPFDRAAYVRGLIDGDGSLGFTAKDIPFISFVTDSQLMAEYVADVFGEIGGVERSPGRNNRDGAYNVMVSNVAAQRVAEYLYPDDTTLAIPRKLEAGRRVAQWTIPEEKAWRYGVVRRAWTPEEDEVAMDNTIAEAAVLLNRTEKSVQVRRVRLRKMEQES